MLPLWRRGIQKEGKNRKSPKSMTLVLRLVILSLVLSSVFVAQSIYIVISLDAVSLIGLYYSGMHEAIKEITRDQAAYTWRLLRTLWAIFHSITLTNWTCNWNPSRMNVAYILANFALLAHLSIIIPCSLDALFQLSIYPSLHEQQLAGFPFYSIVMPSSFLLWCCIRPCAARAVPTAVSCVFFVHWCCVVSFTPFFLPLKYSVPC